MRIEWLNKKGDGRVCIFFNGWGMDKAAVAHLHMDSDLVMIYDYHNLQEGDFPDLSPYSEINIVAWSMGVWAAANLLPEMQIHPSSLIALNGTERPVDNEWGIPEKIYQLTEKGMNEQGREKFMLRMFSEPEEIVRFGQNKPQRALEEVCQELQAIRQQSTGMQNCLKWDKVYISGKDIIFPVQNQQRWWESREIPIQILPGGHYPFYQFHSWREILELKK